MTRPRPIPGLRSITDVVERQLCAGCGACAAAAPGAIEMVDDLEQGRRPIEHALVQADAGHGRAPADLALRVCPGIHLEHDRSTWDAGWQRELADEWGPVLKVWEGHASDEELRFRGSSGGVTSALALHAVSTGAAGGIIHSGPRPGDVLFNDAVRSESREELLERAGSRYSPASPCEGLRAGEGAVAFVGKPCDVAGARRLADHDALEGTEVSLSIAIFCAGAPSTQATVDYLERSGWDGSQQLAELRYRGHGWPGMFHARSAGGQVVESTYDASWGEIQAGRPWRCRICPDHSGEFADISVGDPWHRPPQPGEAGRSLVIARTARGLAAVERAIADGAVELVEVSGDRVPASQEQLRRVRSLVTGRMLAMRLARLPVPQFRGMALRKSWRANPLRERLRTLLGTFIRLGRYGLRSPRRVVRRQPHSGARA